MLAFLTGATGFVGSHVARALVAQGADLRLLVRSGSDLRNIQELQAERVVGDLRDAASLKKAVGGCDVVFHVAADYRLWVRDPEEMYRSNVEGTRAILDAARENKLRRVVYTSSVATMGFQSNGYLADEDSPVSLANMIGPYKRSKFMAEEIAIQAGKSGMDVVVVNPTTPVGERDIKPTPTGRIVVDFLKKKFPAYVDTGLNLVDVAECARGHVVALEKGKSGERYILGGENLTLKQILDKLAAITGLRRRKSGFRMRLRWQPVSWTKCLPATFAGANRARPSTRCAWEGKRCLCHPARPSAIWDGEPCQSMVGCAGRWNGFRRTDTLESGLSYLCGDGMSLVAGQFKKGAEIVTPVATAKRISPMLAVADMDETIAFYQNVLGFTPTTKSLEYSIVERDGQTIHFMKAASEEVMKCVRGHTEIYVEVSGIHALWEHVEALGRYESGTYLIGSTG